MYISRIIHNISHHPPHYIRYIPIMSQCNVPGLPKLDTAWRESGNEERLSRMVRILVAALWDENSIIKTSPIVCWLVVWNIFYFPYIGNLFHHPKWLSLIFFRGVGWNHQPVWIVFGFRISQNHPLSGAKDEQIPYESYEKPWLMGMLGHSTLRGISLPRQTSQDVKPAGLQPSLWPM